jgi:steroid delta-isomerase-like uncharacterized protein
VCATENEAAVRRFYDELWNAWRLELVDELLAKRIWFRGSLGTVLEGRTEFRRYAETIRTAFPDWHNRIDEMLGADDRVAARLTWTGTHLGRLRHLEPTGASVEYVGAAFFRFSRGLIERAWVVGDTQELWRVLGRADEAR